MGSRVEIDGALVVAATSGDKRAVEELVRGLSTMLFGVARRMIANPADAEDASQEALLRILTHLSQYRGEARFSTWAWRIAVRSFLEFREARYRREMLSLEQFEADIVDGLDPGAVERPDDALLLEQLKLGCGAALLGVLDGDHRITYVLGEILDLPGEEVAAILEVPHATVRKRLSRARDRVREVLARTCGMVDETRPCRCHRRLERALELGRVREGGPGPARVALPVLRQLIAGLDAAERAAAFYRADAFEPPPAMVDSILTLLRSSDSPA